MIYCLNPDCRNPQNPDRINFCLTCGAGLVSLLRERYRVLNLLGTGGFGKTYLAEDTDTPSLRRCVIKQLKPIAHNPQIYQLVQERFQREAAILEQLGEENSQIPSLYAYFSVAGYFYLVQQWIDGQTLTQLVQQQVTLSESFVRVALKSLLLVLDEVHSKGIIHRDIKPDNIILSVRADLPVLIDFGAVKEVMGTELNSQGNLTSSIVIGTLGYMPSEQAAGRPVYSSDLYSLGLTAIYALTGKQPQQLNTDYTTGEILWHQYASNLSQDFIAVLDKAIRLHPRERYKSAKDMLDALQSGAVPIPSTTPPQPAVPNVRVSVPDNLSSDVGVDYTRLRNLLSSGNWKDADYETSLVMLEVVGRESGEWIEPKELLNFPCTDLRTIDRLWVKYSNGRFGFSVQKKIYLEVGGVPDGRFCEEAWDKFGDRVGWRVRGSWISYTLILSYTELHGSKAPRGHLPYSGAITRGFRYFFSRIETCKL
ncbi:MAG: GUN4 domain-containing protein [Stigonema ocellatum SAG 48.90 = DSM 106950]|nr:GUN4 domain-containing protein [Stigonema ocellatum SAG 48.90 = DSM 106950]